MISSVKRLQVGHDVLELLRRDESAARARSDEREVLLDVRGLTVSASGKDDGGAPVYAVVFEDLGVWLPRVHVECDFFDPVTLDALVARTGIAPADPPPDFARYRSWVDAGMAGLSALINSLGALGSFVGAYIVGYLNGATGGFGASYIFMAGSLLLSAILTIVAVRKAGEKQPVVLAGQSA